jgi:hypothetical protein
VQGHLVRHAARTANRDICARFGERYGNAAMGLATGADYVRNLTY